MDPHQIAAAAVTILAIVAHIVILVCLWRIARRLERMPPQNEITMRQVPVQQAGVWRESPVVDVERRR